MTILAGAFSRRADSTLPESLCADLIRNVSRNPHDEVASFSDRRCLLAKVDVGAFGASAFRTERGRSVSMLAGEPLLAAQEGVPCQSRSADLELLHGAWDQGNWSALAQCQGVFCAAHYDVSAGRLTLLTDKLGVRQLYYWENEHMVVFASALRILEAIAAVPKEMSLQGVTEIATLGYPLGDRTAYVGIRALRAGETVRFNERETIRARYWRWDALEPTDLGEQALLQVAYERFAEAVTRRLRGDATATALLSGGLDSRATVASLRQRGTTVHTINFNFHSIRGMQDPVFAAQFAREAGTLHHEVPVDPATEAWHTPIFSQQPWTASDPWKRSPPERPQLIWSGDGGSVGVGHVYLGRRIAHLMRSGDRAAAIESYLEQEGTRVVRRIFQPDVARAVADLPAQGIAEELDDIRCHDPARAFHLFLMVNDQHRHFAGFHYEDVDLHRLEFLTPFWDSRFLEIVLSGPVDLCVGHGFYMKWLRHFPQMITVVPWQAYPGHAPCPLPIPAQLRHQWDPNAARDRAQRLRDQRLGLARQLLASEQFPGEILNRSRLRWAYRLFRARLGDYGYAFKFADVYHSYFARCGGRFSATTP